MKMGWDELKEAFSLLGEVLEGRGTPPVDLVVCGGAALRAAGIVGRVTKDVDVLAQRGEVFRELMGASPLPDYVKEAVADVAIEMRLPSGWLNASTSMLMLPLEDLPAEMWAGILEEEYGPSLRVGFVGRVGQIYLKVYAVIGREQKRDVEDLKALAPTTEEWRAVMEWLQSHDLLDDAKRGRLKEVRSELGMEVGHG